MTASATKSVPAKADAYVQVASSENDTEQHGITIFTGPQDIIRVVVGGEEQPSVDTSAFIQLSSGKSLFVAGHEQEHPGPHRPHLPNVWVRAEYKDTAVTFVIGDAKVILS